MEYVEVVDKIDREIFKLEAIALLLADQSEVPDGVNIIIMDSTAALKKTIYQYGLKSGLLKQ